MEKKLNKKLDKENRTAFKRNLFNFHRAIEHSLEGEDPIETFNLVNGYNNYIIATATYYNNFPTKKKLKVEKTEESK